MIRGIIKVFSVLLFLLCVSLISIYIVVQAPMGSTPSGERLAVIEKSRQFNKTKSKFENPGPRSSSTGRRSSSEVLVDFFFNGVNRRPATALPEVNSALSSLQNKSESIRFIWFGHSSVLLEIDSIRILIDPMFSDYASPLPIMAKRFQPPVFDIEQIKNVDVVLISHDHYDHLDYKTIKKLIKRDIHFIVPLGVGAHLEFWGVDKAKITELDWWDSMQFNALKFTCTPARHFSGRGPQKRNTTLWASWVIHGRQQNVFFSGDSGYGPHYKEIGDRLGPFDLTFLENGAYSPDWKFSHQLPEEGVQAQLDLKGNTLVPVHWGMFNLSLHTWYDSVVRITEEADRKGVKILVPKLGELVTTTQAYVQQDWWSKIIPVEKVKAFE